MSFLPLNIQPGIYTENSARTALGRWKDGSNVRFFKGNAEKVTGWIKQIATNFTGICRSMVAWTTLSFARYAALGTTSKLYLSDMMSFFDITPLRASGNLTDPFTTTLGSATVLVDDTAHGLGVGDHVHYSGATAVGGLTLNGEYVVTIVPDVDTYNFTGPGLASSGATGGGTVAFEYEIPVGNDNSVVGLGWGAGGWGIGTWGTTRVSGFLQIARIWSLANWGEDLIASPIGRPIYVWTATGGSGTRAVLISAAPAQNRRVLVSAQLRILISAGSHDGSDPDPMLVRWSDSEDYGDWTPDITNLAGDKRLDNGSEIIGALQSRDEIVLITDKTVYSMTLTGDNSVFGFVDKGKTAGLAGPNAAIDVDGTVYCMGRGQFYTYDGQVQVLPCDVHSRVFGAADVPVGINYTQAAKTFCGRNKIKTEVIWFYCSAGSNEVDSCVGYDHDGKTWWLGTVARTAWLDETPFTDQFNVPIATGVSGTDGTLFLQETGVDDDGAALPYFVETYDMEISGSSNLITGSVSGAGENVYRIKRLIPDFQRLVGTHSATLKGRKYPNGELITKGPVSFGAAVTTIDKHIRARQIAVRIEGSEIGNDISVGQWRADMAQEGGR